MIDDITFVDEDPPDFSRKREIIWYDGLMLAKPIEPCPECGAKRFLNDAPVLTLIVQASCCSVQQGEP
jgi:hypothetical protein